MLILTLSISPLSSCGGESKWLHIQASAMRRFIQIIVQLAKVIRRFSFVTEDDIEHLFRGVLAPVTVPDRLVLWSFATSASIVRHVMAMAI